ncbi:hypothetical protein EUX98_g9122, partial [Antrodiella citrinella]
NHLKHKAHGSEGASFIIERHMGIRQLAQVVGLATHLAKQYKTARIEYREQLDDHSAFMNGFDSRLIKTWLEELDEWEKNPADEKDPYLAHRADPTEIEIRRSLLEEEETAMTNCKTTFKHDISPVDFVTAGLDIEEQQYIFHNV